MFIKNYIKKSIIMNLLEELISTFDIALHEARRLSENGSARNAFEKYKDAIGDALVIDVEATSGAWRPSNLADYLLSEINHAFSLPVPTDIQSASELLLFKTCYEAIEHAIIHDLNFEALSIIEIVKSRRLFKELLLLQAHHKGLQVDHVIHDDFGPKGVEHILSSQMEPTAILSFYLSQLNDELHAFTIFGSSSKWKCERKLILEDEENKRFIKNVKSYIRAVQQGTFETGKKYLSDVIELLGDRLEEQLTSMLALGARKLIIVPHSILHQIPIHAAPFEYQEKRKVIISHFDKVVFTPSLLLYCQIISSKDPNSWNWQVIGNFDIEKLTYGAAGLAMFLYVFNDLKLSLVVNPTREKISRILQKTLIHFDCHGMVNEQDFMNSHIILHNSVLNFREIIESFDFQNTWLVVLNACYTGLNMNPDVMHDEYYGLDGAFLAKGALNVISTLAPVLDVAAFLIIQRTYFNVRFKRMDVSAALQEAQVWLRDGKWKTDVGINSFIKFIEKPDISDQEYLSQKLQDCRDAMVTFLRDAPPDYFQDPVFWAQWKCSGFGENIIRPSRLEVQPI
jgi:hypothetical protein